MATWTLIPSLVQLRAEFNAIAPARDKGSDGSVGDLAHQQNSSDHNPDETGNVPIRDVDKINEVHAIDVDVDLRAPGVTMEDVVQYLLQRCRSGAETRLRYIIFNKRIWSASQEWRQQRYTGANPHDHHAHFSGSYNTGQEYDTSSWELEEEFVAIDYNKIRTIVREEVDARLDQLKVPTAKEVAEAGWNRTRTDVRSPWSDTARRAFLAELSKAVIEQTPIEPFPEAPAKG